MSKLETGLRMAARGALAGCLCLPLLLAAGARAEEGGDTPPSSTLAAFEELYARFAAGAGPAADVAAAAEEVRFRLRTELIRSDAEIEVLKLAAARYDGERQRQALDDLVAAAAARERRLWRAIRQLEALTGQAVAPPSAEPAPQPNDAANDAAGDAGGDAAGQAAGDGAAEVAAEAGEADSAAAEGGTLQIGFEAEDVIEDPDP